MSAREFTTEVYDSEITIVLIDTVGCFSDICKLAFAEKNIQVALRTLADRTNLDEVCEPAYKIVVCVSPTLFTNEVKELLDVLVPYQHKLSLIMPLIGCWQQLVPGEIPFAEAIFEAQRESILYCNNLFSMASFIFGQDLVLPPGYTSLFDLLLQTIQKGSVFVPTVTASPLSLPSFAKAATMELLRPNPGSSVIMGKTKLVRTFVDRAVTMYQAYYFTSVEQQVVEAYEAETIPFSVKMVTVAERLDELVAWYSRSLLSPERPTFFQPQPEKFFSNSLDTAEQVFESPFVFETPIEPETTIIDLPSEEPPVVEPPSPPRASSRLPFENFSLSKIEVIKPVIPKDAKITQPSISLEQFNVSTEIQRIFTQSRMEDKIDRAATLVKKERKIQKSSKKRTTLFYGGMAFTGMGLGVLLLMVIFLSSVFFLKKSISHVLQLATTQQDISESDWKNVKWYQKVLAAQTSTYTSVIELPQLDEAEHLVDAAQKLQTVQSKITEANNSQKQLVASVLGLSTGDVSELAQNSATQSLTAYENLSQLQNDISQISFANSFDVDKVSKNYETQISTLKKQVSIQQQFSPLLASLFGKDERRTYAIVLQNNQELRPTGGFVEAIAVVTFEKGTLISKNIYTSYEIDSKVPGDVQPPAEVSRFLGEKKYFFHDSNWDPDFTVTADRFKWFIEKSLNIKLDGVMTIDLYGLQNLIDVTGPIELPEFNEVVTQKNLFERMEFHSEVVLVDTAKNEDYRKLLFTRFLDKLSSISEDKANSLVRTLRNSFENQSILISFTRPQEQQTLQAVGWTGALLSPNCPSQFAEKPCQVDTFMQVEANVGVNKANYYLKRTVEHTIALSSTLATHHRTITFENTAQSSAWPKGSYKSYIRFYIPNASKDILVTVDGSPLPDQQVIKTFSKGQLIVGFYLETPIKSAKKVELQYSSPLTVTADKNSFSYIFFNHEQPGNGSYPLVVKMVPDQSLKAQVIAPQATVGADGITFLKDSDKTGLYGIQFDQAK